MSVNITDETPKLIDPRWARCRRRRPRAARPTQTRSGTRFENWDTDEPSERRIDGIERMRLVRDDIAARVADPASHLTARSS